MFVFFADLWILRVRKSISVPVEFIPITKPSASDHVSDVNPELIRETSRPPYGNPLEYRFQTFFFFDVLFNHPRLQNYTYIMRIDNDIDLLVPQNYNPFLFMETQGKIMAIRHWSMDPIEICRGYYEPVKLYQVLMNFEKTTKFKRENYMNGQMQSEIDLYHHNATVVVEQHSGLMLLSFDHHK